MLEKKSVGRAGERVVLEESMKRRVVDRDTGVGGQSLNRNNEPKCCISNLEVRRLSKGSSLFNAFIVFHPQILAGEVESWRMVYSGNPV